MKNKIQILSSQILSVGSGFLFILNLQDRTFHTSELIFLPPPLLFLNEVLPFFHMWAHCQKDCCTVQADKKSVCDWLTQREDEDCESLKVSTRSSKKWFKKWFTIKPQYTTELLLNTGENSLSTEPTLTLNHKVQTRKVLPAEKKDKQKSYSDVMLAFLFLLLDIDSVNSLHDGDKVLGGMCKHDGAQPMFEHKILFLQCILVLWQHTMRWMTYPYPCQGSGRRFRPTDRYCLAVRG